jgi:hypothetical protein
MGKGKAKVRLPTGKLWPCLFANIRLSCRDFVDGSVKRPTLKAGKYKSYTQVGSGLAYLQILDVVCRDFI